MTAPSRASARSRPRSCGSTCRSPSMRSCTAPISTASREMVELALALGAQRVEIAHVQYYGWALKNRAALMPTREQVEARGRRGRGTAPRPSRPHRHRRGGAGLLRALPEALRRRLGPRARSTSRRRARCCRATRPRRFPGSNSGPCAIMRSPTSGRTRRRSMRSAAPTGCRSRARAAPVASRISAAAAARPS